MNQQVEAGKLAVKKEVGCCECGLYGLCQVAGLDDPDPSGIDSLVHRRKKISQGELLVRAGTDFHYLYAVKSGMFKTVKYFEDGSEQVVDFHLPGELIGLEALYDGSNPHSVVALDHGSVCEMNVRAMEKLGDRQLPYQQKLIQALSQKVKLDQYQALLVGAQNADQRVALFLMNLAGRFDQHGLPYKQFRLAMLRRDIANYLGLAMETVGRVFKRMEGKGYIRTRGRHTQLVDMRALGRLAGLEGRDEHPAVA